MNREAAMAMNAEVLARLEKAETSDERAEILKDVVGEKLHVVPSNHQLRALFTTVRDQTTSREDFLFCLFLRVLLSSFSFVPHCVNSCR